VAMEFQQNSTATSRAPARGDAVTREVIPRKYFSGGLGNYRNNNGMLRFSEARGSSPAEALWDLDRRRHAVVAMEGKTLSSSSVKNTETEQKFGFDQRNLDLHYGEKAHNFHTETFEMHVEWMRNLDLQGHIIDLGAGSGVLLQRIVPQSTANLILATDISEESLQRGREAIDDPRVTFENLSVYDAGTKYPNQFDHAIIRGAFHHFEEPLRALESTHTTLVNGGKLIILDVLSFEDEEVDDFFERTNRIRQPKDFKFYSRPHLESLLKQKGFEVESFQTREFTMDLERWLGEYESSADLYSLYMNANEKIKEAMNFRKVEGKYYITFTGFMMIAEKSSDAIEDEGAAASPVDDSAGHSEILSLFDERLKQDDETVIDEIVKAYQRIPKGDPGRQRFYEALQRHQSRLAAKVLKAIGINWDGVVQYLVDVATGTRKISNPRSAARQLVEIVDNESFGGLKLTDIHDNEVYGGLTNEIGAMLIRQATEALRAKTGIRDLTNQIAVPSFPEVKAGTEPGKFVILRHGKTNWSKPNVDEGDDPKVMLDKWAGWFNSSITETGREMAREAGVLLRPIHFDQSFQSHLIRSQQTRKEFIDGRGSEIPVEENEAIAERHYGLLAGWNREDVEETFPEMFLEWRRSISARPLGGESLEDVMERAIPFFVERILGRIAVGENVIFSGHNNANRSMLVAIVNHTRSINRQPPLTSGEVKKFDFPLGIPVAFRFSQDLSHEELWGNNVSDMNEIVAFLSSSSPTVPDGEAAASPVAENRLYGHSLLMFAGVEEGGFDPYTSDDLRAARDVLVRLIGEIIPMEENHMRVLGESAETSNILDYFINRLIVEAEEARNLAFEAIRQVPGKQSRWHYSDSFDRIHRTLIGRLEIDMKRKSKRILGQGDLSTRQVQPEDPLGLKLSEGLNYVEQAKQADLFVIVTLPEPFEPEGWVGALFKAYPQLTKSTLVIYNQVDTVDTSVLFGRRGFSYLARTKRRIL